MATTTVKTFKVDHTLRERFERFVYREPNTGCWLWGGHCNEARGGYGTFRSGGRTMYAHRFAWERDHGPISDGMSVLHSCDVPCCVNVAHLFLGTQLDNMRDMHSKGRGVAPPLIVGTDNGNAKLDPGKVRQIRAELSAGHLQRVIAERHGVAKSLIYAISKRLIWAHVE